MYLIVGGPGNPTLQQGNIISSARETIDTASTSNSQQLQVTSDRLHLTSSHTVGKSDFTRPVGTRLHISKTGDEYMHGGQQTWNNSSAVDERAETKTGK